MNNNNPKLNIIENTFTDTRIVYGARCVWWDSIDKVATDKPIPTCPHCGNILFEMESPEVWWGCVDTFEAAGHPGYRRLVEWMRGKCFPTTAAAREAYKKETGREVV